MIPLCRPGACHFAAWAAGRGSGAATAEGFALGGIPLGAFALQHLIGDRGRVDGIGPGSHGLTLQPFRIHRAAVAKAGEDVGKLLRDAAKVARVSPVGGILPLRPFVYLELKCDALQQGLALGIPFGVAGGGGLFRGGGLFCSAGHVFRL